MGFESLTPSQAYNRVMERNEIERTADEIIARYDEDYFEVMNRILDEVRAEANSSASTRIAQNIVNTVP